MNGIPATAAFCYIGCVTIKARARITNSLCYERVKVQPIPATILTLAKSRDWPHQNECLRLSYIKCMIIVHLAGDTK